MQPLVPPVDGSAGLPGLAEVAELDPREVRPEDEDVVQLHVPVDQTVRVDVLKGVRQLVEEEIEKKNV